MPVWVFSQFESAYLSLQECRLTAEFLCGRSGFFRVGRVLLGNFIDLLQSDINLSDALSLFGGCCGNFADEVGWFLL